LVLTSAEWDHYDVFASPQEYQDNYQNLISTLPTDGLLVLNLDGKDTQQFATDAPCRVVTYSFANPEADYQATKVPFDTSLLGEFNLSNLTAAYALLCELGFEPAQVLDALDHYHGLVYRMQVLFESDDLVVIRDLAHSPVKAQAALQAIRTKWPHHYVVGVFEIFASSLKSRSILPELSGRFEAATKVIIPKVDQIERIEATQRVTGKEIVAAIGTNAVYMPKDEIILELLTHLPAKSVVLFMSSGGLRGIPEHFLSLINES
jgi:UDP-N-acetylmuramate-alanine ligase